MDKAEKTDCGANGEIILHTKSPLLPESSNIGDPISLRIGLRDKEGGTLSASLQK